MQEGSLLSFRHISSGLKQLISLIQLIKKGMCLQRMIQRFKTEMSMCSGDVVVNFLLECFSFSIAFNLAQLTNNFNGWHWKNPWVM